MYQVFRLLSILFMGLTSATFSISLLIATLFLGYGKPILSIVRPIIFSLSGFFLSSFAFYSFGVLENIKIKVKALDEIYNGKALYREYIATRGEDR